MCLIQNSDRSLSRRTALHLRQRINSARSAVLPPRLKTIPQATRCATRRSARVLCSLPGAMGNDTMLEVAFDRAGTKKLMANYAKLEKI
mgnify:CR=1 FL=1